MKYVKLPEDKQYKLPFYLAMEEYIAENCGEDLLFTWQVEPTVIFGRNQVMLAEVNVDYCEQHHIQYYRRKSGGGCVYADKGNIMTSYITPKVTSDVAFNEFLNNLADVLRKLGFDAVKTEHNDILIGGRKVSGNALFQKEKASIVHGTLMYDVDIQTLMEAITPPKQKLEKHGIESVRQRVVNLKELGLKLSVEELRNHIAQSLCDGEKVLTDDEVNEIQKKIAEAKAKGDTQKISTLNAQLSTIATPDFAGKEYLLQRQLKTEARGDIIQRLREANIRPTAMMDISDGLSSELMHICKQSHVGCRVFEKQIPIDYQTAVMAEELNMNVTTCALNGGEDYELLFTVPIGDHEKIEAMEDVKLIGHITKESLGHILVTRDDQEFELKAQGWNPL